MAEEGRGVALAILGIVALIAVVGLILLFSGRMTGRVVTDEIYGGYGANKVYGGWARAQEQAPRGSIGEPYAGSWVKGVPVTPEGQNVAVIGGSQARYRVPSTQTKNCPAGLDYIGARQAQSLSDSEYEACVLAYDGEGLCCELEGLNPYGPQQG